ncbi:MAG: site-2 protease family protein [Oscillospiraceae bacterium]|jgi:regulator of sigma E protease|nr:site-2 protease family protein [Oscillospiraceae bacterium]
MGIIYGIVIFCLIIIIHELGHYAAARLFGMKVYEFMLGMGPLLWKHRAKNGTLFTLRAIPFGGAVSLGEDEDDTSPDAFRNRPVIQRMVVILAGIVMNLGLGLIVCVISSATSDKLITTTLAGFRDNAVSSLSLAENDKIVNVNGLSIITAADLSYALYNSASKMADNDNSAVYDFTVMRNGERLNLPNVTFAATSNGKGGKTITLDFYVYSEEKSFGAVIADGAKSAVSLSRLVVISLIDIIKGTYGLNDFSGPVGVVNEISKAAAMGFDEVLTMFALITLNVGIFNLLPVPGLDGSRFLFFVLEAVRRKPVKAEIEGFIHFLGFAALMVLMLVITFNDIKKLFTGEM